MTEKTRRWLAGSIVAALVAAALVALAGEPAAAAGAACRKTYSSTSAPIAINDGPSNGGPSMLISVPDAATVADIDVTVNIEHTYDQDLWIYFGNNSKGETLAGHFGGSGQDFTNTTFDDEATVGIGAGTAPFTGRFQPEMPLSRFDGGATNDNNWRLQVTDTFAGSTGTFLGWSMSMEFASCDFDADGVEDHHDSCLGLAAATASGCPAVGRTLSAKYRHGTFRGTLGATVPACAAGMPVTVWKVRTGSDKRVGTALTRSDGRYRLTRARHPGRYYATAPTAVLTDVAECAAATAARFRLR